jgi:hypothetical protein
MSDGTGISSSVKGCLHTLEAGIVGVFFAFPLGHGVRVMAVSRSHPDGCC